MSDFLAQLARRQSDQVGSVMKRDSGPNDDAPAATTASPAVASVDPASKRPSLRALLVDKTGLFDAAYYLANNPDIAQAGLDPLEHFLDAGYREQGRKPNPYFDPIWYLDRCSDVRKVGQHPLVHYALYGDAEGRQPCRLFDTAWYRQQYAIPNTEPALAHYLRHRTTCKYSPIPDFDVEYYARKNPDVAAAGIDPFEHFLLSGFREGRNPSTDFDVKFYARRYLGGDLSQNPFLHYLDHKHEPGIVGRMPDDEATIPREVTRFTRPGPHFEEFKPLPASAAPRAKLLAYYLPQFHAFPENDAWWGKGFTEWTNIVRGLPRFKGHYQPRVPRDLGFYSLDTTDTLRRQVTYAKGAGVSGFVFYYYWFNGKRLLEKPVEQFLADNSIDMPFALIWANENWSRRWDGSDSEVLISQDYRADDEAELVEDFARHFRDPRYIRLQGRPLLMLYRPGLIPQTAETVARWRCLFRARFNENPIITMAQGFGDTDPTVYGLDGAIEFPPHKLTEDMREVNEGLELLDPEFTAQVLDYDRVADVSLSEPAPDFPLIKTAFPSWDNDARRQGAGTIIHGSTPRKYEAWLSRLIRDAVQRPFFGEPIVCINAWNEWAEGAYLEPDLHHGAAYLNATGRAVAGLERVGDAPRLALVGHDAHPHGAQELLLNIGRTLRRSFGVEIEYLLLDGGRLTDRYGEIARTTVASTETALKNGLNLLRERGFASAIVNTTAAAHIVQSAGKHGLDCIVLVHELPRIIREKNLTRGAATALKYARKIVFPAPFVRDELLKELDAPAADNQIVAPQGAYKVIGYAPESAARVRRELNIPASDALVLCVGYADLRKGFDLFLQLWRQLRDERREVHFCWVGGIDPALAEWMQVELRDATAAGTLHMVNYTDDVAAYFSAADVFALTSREDPFPSVALEALSAGIPVVAFDRSGGIPDMLREYGAGKVVPYCDVPAMATELRAMLGDGLVAEEDRTARRDLIAEHFQWKAYVSHLLALAMPNLGQVSVAVPNYNYARHMAKRLGSIFSQTYPVHEIIVLDDCSTDDSLAVIATVAAEWDREIQLVPNAQNSGSVFAQWRKAAELASGEFLWIAEADDLSRSDFLARLMALLCGDRDVRFAFSDSASIHHDGSPIGASYKPYYATVEPGALTYSETFAAAEFARRFLAVKNVILNVSAVVWRRDALLRALDACEADLHGFRMAGDWRLYLQALAEPEARVAYEAEPLNMHRRHGQSVTHTLDAELHVDEIARVHAFARQVRITDAPAEACQASYLLEVSAQLGIAPASTGSPAEESAPEEPVTDARPVQPPAQVADVVRRRPRRRAVSSKRE
jgi:glycosyltransferase involved in cell wall biosynthesis